MFRSRFSPVWFALLIACSGSLHAAAPDRAKPHDPTAAEADSRQDEMQRRRQIATRTERIFTLIGAEMAHEHGNIPRALSMYYSVLNQSKDPQVAERTMEMALNAQAAPFVDAAAEIWHQAEPVPDNAQKQMLWWRDLAEGGNAATFEQLPDVMQHAAEPRRRRLFLLLAQSAVRYPDLITAQSAAAVHTAAAAYPDLPEAALADLMFGGSGQTDLLAALQRLAQTDPELLPASQYVVGMAANRHPALLAEFFRTADRSALSPAWLTLEVADLMQRGEDEQAYSQIQALASRSDADYNTYLTAAKLSARRSPADTAAPLAYFDRAYQHGSSSQKADAAFNAALFLASAADYAQAQTWLDKIPAAHSGFDAAALRAMIAAERKDWQSAYRLTQAALAQHPASGDVFDRSELERIYFFSAGRILPPAKVLAELNRSLAQAERARSQEGYADRVSEILYQRALLYADRLGQPEKAVADLRRFMTMNPDSTDGRNTLGYTLLVSRPDYLDEAFELIQAAYREQPDNMEINDSMGWAYYKKGDIQNALAHLRFAYEKDKNAETAAHLGEVYWTQGQQQEARRVWLEGWLSDRSNRVLLNTLKRFGVSFK